MRRLTVLLTLLTSVILSAPAGAADKAPPKGGAAQKATPKTDPKTDPKAPAEGAKEQGGVAGLTKLPVLTQKVEAIYPPRALTSRVEGQVVLELDLDASGVVENVSVAKSSTVAGEPAAWVRSSTISAEGYGFVAAARAAAYQLTFEPAEDYGNPVPVRISYTFKFKLPPLPAPVATTGVTKTTTAAEKPRGLKNFFGTVLERGTRAKVKGAVVTVFRGEGKDAHGFEATTDADGHFELFDLEAGEWSVQAEADGYFPFRTKENLEGGVALEVAYYVEKGSANPLDVLVEAPRPKKEVNRRTLTTAEIVKVPGTLGDPILVVENLPGVARAQPGNIVVRGSGPQDTQVFIDGINVPLIYHFGALRSVVPAEAVDSIDFYPGNFSTYYGRGLGGVFDAHMKRLSSERVHGVLDVSLLDASLYLEVPVDKTFSFALAGRRSYIDAILNAVVPKDGSVSLTSAPRYYDYQAMTRWRPNASHDLRLSFIGSDDALEILFNNPGNLNAQLQARSLNAGTRFWRAIAAHDFAITPELKNQLTVAFGRDVIESRFGDQFGFNLDILHGQAREGLSYRFGENFSLTGGIDAEYLLTDVDIKTPGSPPKEGDSTQPTDLSQTKSAYLHGVPYFTFAPFVEAELKLDRLTLVPGLRFDYVGQVDSVSIDPRLVARYQLTDQWVAKAGAGVVHQAPQPDETTKEYGNPALGLETAVQYSAGAEWKPEPYFSIDATLFYKDMSRLVSRTSAATIENGQAVPLVYDNGGKGRVYGFELFIKHDLSRNLSGWLTYTLSRAERLDSGAANWRLFDYDQTHILTLVASYRLPENWELGIRWRMISGSPYTPVTSGALNSDADNYSPIPGAVNSGRLPLFHQLDVRLDKRWIFDSWILSAYLSLTNAYNNPAVDGFNYRYDYTQSVNQQGLPIYPILGLRAEL